MNIKRSIPPHTTQTISLNPINDENRFFDNIKKTPARKTYHEYEEVHSEKSRTENKYRSSDNTETKTGNYQLKYKWCR